MKKYNAKVKIPKELDLRVDEAIYEGLNSKRKESSIKKISIGVVAFFGIFITLLNTVPVFAKTVYEIDIIGDICRFFTFREYKYEDDVQYVNIHMPEFHYTENSSLENRINLEISRVVHEQYNDAKENALEYYEDFITACDFGTIRSGYVPENDGYYAHVEIDDKKFLLAINRNENVGLTLVICEGVECETFSQMNYNEKEGFMFEFIYNWLV